MSPPYPSDGVGWGGVGGKSCSHHALSTSLGTSELLGKDQVVEQLLRQGGNLLKLKKKIPYELGQAASVQSVGIYLRVTLSSFRGTFRSENGVKEQSI